MTFFGRFRHRILPVFAVVAGLSAAWPTAAQPTPNLTLTPFASGLTAPVDIAHAPGDARLFVVEQPGRIRLVTAAGAVLPTPFLDISARVVSGGEQGLLGLAFHPDYAVNGYFFVNYIDLTGSTRIARFQRSTLSPDAADPASEVVFFTTPQPYSNHNGGSLQFGPTDGYLYASLGDGGAGGDPDNRAQNLASPLGKVLRFDVNTPAPGGATPYSIPPGNPLVNTAGARPEIWLWGLRNPWRTAFDAVTGTYWLGDVGQNFWEEVDAYVDSAGANRNFGWRCYEANAVYNSLACGAPTAYHAPVHAYDHAVGWSISGGVVYRGAQLPALVGHYVFADYGSGYFWTIRPAGAGYVVRQDPTLQLAGIACFGQDAAGEVYVANVNTGQLLRLGTTPTGTTPPHRAAPLRVTPNPAAGACRVELPLAIGAEVELLHAVTGQVIRRTRASAATAAATLDLHGLAPGTYAVRAWLPDGPRTQRVVVAASE